MPIHARSLSLALAFSAITTCGGAAASRTRLTVHLSPGWVALVPRDSIRATAIAFDSLEHAVTTTFTWETSNPQVATVDADGWVRGVGFGTTEITARAGTAAGNGMATATVVVAPARLIGAGDIARCRSSGDEATAALLDTLPGIVVTAGDNAYASGTATEFNNCYHPSWGRHRARTRPSPGNHDYRTNDGAPYFRYFGPLAGDSGVGYYSFDFAGWHVVSLNSNVSMAAGSPQERWLRADLAAHPAACTLAYWHHPRFSSGRHGSSPASTPLWQALSDAGADVIVVGHDHTYERFAPQTPAGVADAARGIRQFVVGTGGASHYDLLTVVANSELRDNTSYGVLVLTLRPAGYDWRFVPVAGATFTDSGTGGCH